jgi:hypothetical protein
MKIVEPRLGPRALCGVQEHFSGRAHERAPALMFISLGFKKTTCGKTKIVDLSKVAHNLRAAKTWKKARREWDDFDQA